jgi:multidrug efflux system membrane fusion protein
MDDRTTTTDLTRPKPEAKADTRAADTRAAEPALKSPPAETPLDRPAKRRSKAGRRIGLLLFIAGLGAAGWWFYDRKQQQAPGIAQAPGPAAQPRGGGRFNPNTVMPVVVAPAVTGDMDIEKPYLGTVTSLATVTIRSQISGYLVNVNYNEGQAVKKGDVLAEIDDRSYRLAQQNAEGALARDQAMLQSAELDLKRYQDLIKTNAVPRQQLDQQVALVAQNKANILSDQAQIEVQKLNIIYCHIIAPVNGRVGLRLVDQGNYVTPGDASGLVVITQFQPITVIFPVAEDHLPQIMARLKAAGTLPVTVFDRENKVKLAAGQLKTIDNQIDTTTGTVRLRAEFANDDEALFPNQFVNVRLLVDTLKGVSMAPMPAIQRGAPGPFVYLLNDDQTVTVRPVKLGPDHGDRVVVEQGLSPGDRVVIDGADKLRGGAKVAPRDVNGAAIGAPVAAPPGGAPPPPQAGEQRRGDGTGNGSRRRRGGDQ